MDCGPVPAIGPPCKHVAEVHEHVSGAVRRLYPRCFIDVGSPRALLRAGVRCASLYLQRSTRFFLG